MRIVTYANVGGDAPAGMEAVARIVDMGRDAKGRPVEVQQPIIIYGRSADDAREKAQDWWDEQMAKESKKLANARAAGERLAQSRKAKAEPATSGLHTLNKRKDA